MIENLIRVKLPTDYHPRLNRDFADRIKYLVPNVKDVRFQDTSAEVLFDGPVQEGEEQLHDKIGQILEEVSFTGLEFQETVLRENLAQYVPLNFVPQAIEKGWLFELANGVYGVSGFLYNLKQHLDARFADIANEFSARPIELPSFIATKDLLKSGHFETFPHHVYLNCHIDFTRKERTRIEKNEEGGALGEKLVAHATHSDFCLTPSVCYNYYRSMEGRTVDDIQSSVVTAKCRCFRYELSEVRPFQRQREFEMREIIFLGKPQEVGALRDRIMFRTWEMALELDLKARIKNAFDPFFTENLGARAAVQFNRNMKYELLAECGHEAPVAISSFNVHSATFGKAFDIKGTEGRPVNSGCIGFGLERWVLALVSKHGLEKTNWPAAYHHLF